MKQIRDPFKPVIGQLVWCVRRGHGSFLTMEFGMPHLSVREPTAAGVDSTERVRRNLKRRRVFVVGDWHLWIKYGEWKLSTAGGVLDSRSPSGSPLDECLGDLDGQRLISVEAGSTPASTAAKFDLGGLLEVWPSQENADDQWSLHSWNGDIATWRSDGVLTFEK
jgi:hypothetical protein